jgi:hypothetical protein
MKWMKERDLLIAQTMAFVQSVTGKKATAEAREVLIQTTSIESTPIESTLADEIEKLARPVETSQTETSQTETLQTETSQTETLQTETLQIETGQIARPTPVRLSDVRQEIRGRVAAFRAHQELFHRERDEYYNSVLTKVRASTGQAPKAPDDQPSRP